MRTFIARPIQQFFFMRRYLSVPRISRVPGRDWDGLTLVASAYFVASWS
jgi:hypothetical protein